MLGRATGAMVALGCALWLALAPAAPAHLGHEAAGAGRADPGEIGRLGTAHARAHAMARAMDEARRQRTARRTPAQRRQRQAQSRRETQAFNARLAGQRDDRGYWDPTLYPLPDYAINAIVLPTNKILIFGREPTGPGGTRSNLGSARLYDPVTGATRHVPPPPIPENAGMPAPIFCAGQTTLSDGRILLAGGNLSDPVPGRPDFSGLNYTFIFDPWNEANPWQLGPRMTHGRWYPTLTRLASGDVLIASGLDEDGQATRNGRLDIWRPGESEAVPLAPLEPYPAGERNDPSETSTPNLDPDAQWGMSLYPYMHTLPDGNVALAGPGHQDSAILDTAAALDRNGAPGSAWTQIMRFGPLPGQIEEGTTPSRPHTGGMGLMEPNIQGFQGSWNLIAMAGSDDAVPGEYKPARPVVDRFDAQVRRWTRDPDLNQGRLYANSVLLPDGGIVVVGGGLGIWREAPGLWYVGEHEPGGPPPQLKQVELRQPGERTWRLGAAQREFRAYHSTAVLLPDGRVMSAGDDGREKLTASRDDAEIYWPPNLFDGDACALRPVIRGVGAPGAPPAGARQWATLTYGEPLGIFSEHAGAGMRAMLVAPAATTHSFDMNQRLVPLTVNGNVAGGGLNVTMPATAAIAPPGYYMLFVVGPDGTPSEARWVHVLAPAAAAAERGGVAPATVSAEWPNPEGRRCVNPDGTQRSEPYTRPAGDPAPAPTGPSAPGTGGSSRPAKQPAKLALTRATIHRASRRLDVVAPISALASGRVAIELTAAARRTRMTSAVDARKRRVRVLRAIPAAQARLGTGILTIRYKGNDATLPQTVRLRAAARPARLVARRPTLDTRGRLRASGTISPRARGVVRIELQLATAAGGARTLAFRAPIRKGRWTLRAQLTRAQRAAIAARAGTVHASTLFTGYGPLRMRGEMRSHQVLGAP